MISKYQQQLVVTTIRLTLTIVLLFAVYQETGPWTTLCLALLVLAVELSAVSQRLLRKKLENQTFFDQITR